MINDLNQNRITVYLFFINLFIFSISKIVTNQENLLKTTYLAIYLYVVVMIPFQFLVINENVKICLKFSISLFQI